MDHALYIKIQDQKFETLLETIKLINGTSEPIVDKMMTWRSFPQNKPLPKEHFDQIKNWVRSNAGGPPLKVARVMMWWIIIKYLELQKFETEFKDIKKIKLDVTFS